MKPKTTTLFTITFVIALLLPCLQKAIAQETGQVFAPATILTGQTRYDCQVSYLGQPAEEGKLVLDANNGFFDGGVFRAEGKRQVADSDKEFISAPLFPPAVPDTAARWGQRGGTFGCQTRGQSASTFF